MKLKGIKISSNSGIQAEIAEAEGSSAELRHFMKMSGAALEDTRNTAVNAPSSASASGGKHRWNADYVPQPPEVLAISEDDIRRVLTRIRPSTGLRDVLKKICNAGDEGLNSYEICKALNYDRSQFAGLMGAFGRRIKGTFRLDPSIAPIEVFFKVRWLGTEYHYAMWPLARKVVREELA